MRVHYAALNNSASGAGDLDGDGYGDWHINTGGEVAVFLGEDVAADAVIALDRVYYAAHVDAVGDTPAAGRTSLAITTVEDEQGECQDRFQLDTRVRLWLVDVPTCGTFGLGEAGVEITDRMPEPCRVNQDAGDGVLVFVRSNEAVTDTTDILLW